MGEKRNQSLVSVKRSKKKKYMENYLKINYMEELKRKKPGDLVVRTGGSV